MPSHSLSRAPFGTPRIAGLATAVPPYEVSQSEAADFAGSLFARELPEVERLLEAFGNAGIERRQLARPKDWYGQPRSFPEKNRVYREVALELSLAAARGALERSAIRPSRVGAVVLVSSTGISTPSLDGALIQALGLPRSTARLPLWGLGCAGGAAGLAHAAALARGLGTPVLLVAVELCSTTFMHRDRSKANLIATALFGDGAAAAVVAPEGEGPALLRGHSHLVDGSADVMGWSLQEEGLRVVFSRSIPALVREVVPRFVADAGALEGLAPGDLHRFVFHPGGARVLEAYAEALGLERESLAASADVLRDHGNMSSPTVLFVLERFLETTPATGEKGLLLALGPGFSAEGVLFRW